MYLVCVVDPGKPILQVQGCVVGPTLYQTQDPFHSKSINPSIPMGGVVKGGGHLQPCGPVPVFSSTTTRDIWSIHLSEFGSMCWMLGTFHVSPRIVQNISGSSLLSQ